MLYATQEQDLLMFILRLCCYITWVDMIFIFLYDKSFVKNIEKSEL